MDKDTIREDFEARGRDHGKRENAEGRLLPIPKDIAAQVNGGNLAGYQAFLYGWNETKRVVA